MIFIGPNPGFVAVSFTTPDHRPVDLRGAASACGVSATDVQLLGDLEILTWGPGASSSRAQAHSQLLTKLARRYDHSMTSMEIDAVTSSNSPDDLAEILPPFAAYRRNKDASIILVTDVLGFRHLYFIRSHNWSAVSTSSRLLARLAGVKLDEEAIAVQSLLGWQLGARTLYERVHKTPAGSVLVMEHGVIRIVTRGTRRPAEQHDLDGSVRAAAGHLRDYMEKYLDDYPDAALQLTGGQDSRILLSAIPEKRRKGLKVITLSVPGSDDVAIAARLAHDSGMNHQVATLEGLDTLLPAEAFELCLAASGRVDAMADPLSMTSVMWAESQFDQGPRLSGLGGEVARGFYYLGDHDSAITRDRTARLAAWRIFANESIDPSFLQPAFASRARAFTLEELFNRLTDTECDWLSATDEFYLWQRMQRWAGVTDTAVCFDRAVVNPMLDQRFLNIARGLAPKFKRGGLFLGRIQVDLDDALARIPLDGRPAPIAFAHPSGWNSLRIRAARSVSIRRKIYQRLSGSRRPPGGAQILAEKIRQHWVENPGVLDSVRSLDVLRPEWLDGVAVGRAEAPPSAVAFMVNLLGATGPL